MANHNPLWVRDRFKCPCFRNMTSQVSCEGIDHVIATGGRQRFNYTDGRSYKVSLPLCYIVLVEFEVTPHLLSEFSSTAEPNQFVDEFKEQPKPNFTTWLGDEDNFRPVARGLEDYYTSVPEYGIIKNLIMTGRRTTLACVGRSHSHRDDNHVKVTAHRYGVHAAALANAYTLVSEQRCFSCWDATRLLSSGALVPGR